MKPPHPSEMWLAHLAGVCATGVLLSGATVLAVAVVRRLAGA